MDTLHSAHHKLTRMFVNVLCLFAILAVVFAAAGSAYAQADARVKGWQQVNVNGFGDGWTTGVISLEVFQGELYAGTANLNTGGQVWRWQNNDQWQQVSESGFGSGSTNWAIIDLAVFQGNLYAGMGWDAAPGQVWRTVNGINWTPVTTDGFGDGANIAITNFAVFRGMLYAGTGTVDTGAQIWRSRTGNGDSWIQVAPDGAELAGNVTGFAVYRGVLYAAVEPAGGFGGPVQVWRSTNGSDWEIGRASCRERV